MVLLFYSDDFLMFIPSKDKIDEVYSSLWEHFNIEDYVYLNKYLGVELDRRTRVSIHLSQPYITQRIHLSQPYLTKIILNVIRVMEK